jgi:anti-anti-sigma factor
MTQPEPLVITFEREEYDLATCDEFGAALEPTYGVPNVILDLSHVTFMDSTCLGKLAGKRKRREKIGYPPARLVINPTSHLRRLVKIVSFDKIWRIFDTLDEALADARTDKAG